MAASRPLRIAFLPSFNADLLPRYLGPLLTARGITPEFYVPGFDQHRQAILDQTSELYQFKPDVVILFVDGQDLLADMCQSPLDFDDDGRRERVDSALADVSGWIRLVRERLPEASLLINNLAPPAISGLGILEYNSPFGLRAAFSQFNLALGRVVRETPRAFVVDYDALVARHGHENWADDRMWYLGRMRLGRDAFEALARAYATHIGALAGSQKKCLVLDLDNTLWGGVIGTDGLGGVQLGAEGTGLAYREFQAELLNLYKRGVLLAVNSKNNWEDAIEAIDHHPDMVLRREHFAAIHINWEDKAENLREISETLNIGLDSLVFMDDDPFQIEWVRDQLPEVQTIQAPDDPSKLRATLLDLDAFATLALTDEDRARGRMYHQEGQRQELRKTASTPEEFLATLNMRATIAPPSTTTRPRIAQLTQKTNQFNLTTRRYTEAEVENFENEAGSRVYGLSVSDKFGDSGLVGVAAINSQDEGWRIDTLLLSCRAMGRTVETAFLAFLAQRAREDGADFLIGEYLPTTKNTPVRELYAQHGFQPADDGGRMWRLDLRTAGLSYPDYIRIELQDELVSGAPANR